MQISQLIKPSLTTLAAAAIVTVAAGTTFAESAIEKGYKFATLNDKSDNGFGDSTSNVTMTLKNKAGKSSKRTLRILTLERSSSKVGDKSISIFSSPADIDGTAVLSHAKITANDDQWIYLPAASRIKRISSANKSGPFVGSEFAYEDITAQELGKFKYKWLEQDACGSATCEVVERIPTYKNSGYSRQEVWISTANWQVQKIQFYGRSGNHVKTLKMNGYKQYGKAWRQSSMTMVNLRNGKSTILAFANWKFKTGLNSADFRSSGLEDAQ